MFAIEKEFKPSTYECTYTLRYTLQLGVAGNSPLNYEQKELIKNDVR